MTRQEIERLLEAVGVRGEPVVVHASLSSFGQVDGGADTVCEALLAAVGESGTVVLPAFTCAETLNDKPRGAARTRSIAFLAELPVSREIGVVAEAFRRYPGVLRSSHPTHSFAAWGRQARDVLSTQRDNNPLGPLKKLNVLQGYVLMIGTTLQAAVAVHLAEEARRMPYLARRTAVRINAAGYDERVVLESVPGCSRAFVNLEDQLDPQKIKTAALARGAVRRIPIRHLVSLASAALERDARAFVCGETDCASCAAKLDALGGWVAEGRSIGDERR